jgi:regulatory protein
LLVKDDADEAEGVAFRLAARAEQSRAGLLAKLRARGFSRDAALSALDKLTEQNIVNDDRFARMWVESRLRARARGKAESPRALRERLLAKGISQEAAASAVAAALDGEAELGLLQRFLEQFAQSRGGRATKDALRREGFSVEAVEAVELP